MLDQVTGAPVSATIDQPYYLPAHLEYHESEKKWKEGRVPNKDIILKDCFNICQKLGNIQWLQNACMSVL